MVIEGTSWWDWGEVCAVWCPLARAVGEGGGGAATAGAIGAAAAGVRAGRLDVHSVSAATFCRAAASLAGGCGTAPCSTEHLQLRAKAAAQLQLAAAGRSRGGGYPLPPTGRN